MAPAEMRPADGRITFGELTVPAARRCGVAILVTEPLHLDPLLVPKPWGGRALERYGRDLPVGQSIGESWEVADLDPRCVSSHTDPVTRVCAGPFAGYSLQQLIERDREGLLGDAATADGRFPLLIKLLDAHEHLSIQVHPPATYVERYPDAALKTESWVIMAARPGAHLLRGVRDGVTLEAVQAALGTPELVELLAKVPARAGEVHHLPAGTIHALGPGIVVAEVQTPSDTTFRLFDWPDRSGHEPRELHLEPAREAIALGWEHNVPAGRAQDVPVAARHGQTDGDGVVLFDTPHYRTSRYDLEAGAVTKSHGGSARVVQVMSGELTGEGFAWPLPVGGTVVLPAAWSGTLRALATATWLETRIPG